MTRTLGLLGRHPLLPLVLLLSWLAAAVEAQGVAELLSQIPSCALPCLTQGLADGNCSLTSVVTAADCLCLNIPLQSDLSTCVQLNCHFEDQARAASLETSLCAAYPKESRSHEVKTIAIALSVITFPVVALRCISRWMITRRLWWDDWTAVFATVLLAGLAGIEIASADLGFGTHYWNVELAAGTKLIQLFYVVQQLYILIQVFAKISILLFFSRIFPARWFQLTVRCFIAFLLIHGLVFLLVIVFQCTPISSTWDRSNPDRKCLNVTAIGYAGAVLSIVEDLVILVLPIPELVKLQLNIRKKIALGFMFSLGSFACITTMVRLKYLVMFSSTFDTTWDNVDIVIWSIVEEFCAILCASLPALRPLLQKVPQLFTSKKETTKETRSTAQSRRSILHIGKDKFHELPETPVSGVDDDDDEEDQPPALIDIADQMAAQADGKRPVVFAKDKETTVNWRADVELQNVKAGKRWQKDVNGRL
ncbi:Putative extracellular membrane protein, CFEM [Colletotrichum destructivum]|uniref:Extracellular membrane protein, CFEM n=1 Tax=Colletotrichum destructivum TaxID=34406 RepID=A0AAX4IUW7_9PEZI|nr:Putative extracellular membrane protein, CFEM [Colletotrichum destructivum]